MSLNSLIAAADLGQPSVDSINIFHFRNEHLPSSSAYEDCDFKIGSSVTCGHRDGKTPSQNFLGQIGVENKTHFLMPELASAK